jgi:hypothetical protein
MMDLGNWGNGGPWQKKIKKALKIFFRRVILISLRFFKGQIK